MKKYEVKTFARNNGQYDRLRTEATFTNRHDAEGYASIMATNDAALYSLPEGFVVVAYEGKRPYVAFEHDGIRLTVWRGEEIADGLWD